MEAGNPLDTGDPMESCRGSAPQFVMESVVSMESGIAMESGTPDLVSLFAHTNANFYGGSASPSFMPSFLSPI